MRTHFHRTVWSTTNATDETCIAVLWSGNAAGTDRFSLELEQLVSRLGAASVTPMAQASLDGETWSDVAWVGSPPWSVTDSGPRRLGPYCIDPSHGKPRLRIGLAVKAWAAGPGLVVALVRGELVTASG